MKISYTYLVRKSTSVFFMLKTTREHKETSLYESMATHLSP